MAAQRTLALALGIAAAASWSQPAPVQRVEVTAPRASAAPFPARADGAVLRRASGGTGDTARLLRDLPGVSLYGAGGLSSLPALNGLADDRVRTLVDGMDLVASCPNHMNSPLSYLDPSQVAQVRVYAGVAPVSLGGDSLGGTVQVEAAAPVFAEAGAQRTEARLGGHGQASGRARGATLWASWAGENLHLAYSAASNRRDNYRAARAFKPEAAGTEGGLLIAGDVVGSTAYDARNDELALALQHDPHLLQFKLARQRIGFEAYPNQRMDMTGNRSTQLNLSYAGRFAWGEVKARAYQQKVNHEMDMGPDRYFYGFGMPMDTESITRGSRLQATLPLGAADSLRLGFEGQTYVLYDWWPAVGGSMGPNAFWNIDYGRRHKAGAFVEWDAFHGEHWFSQLGLRADRVMTDAATVQGYDNGLGAIWGNEAAAFNALQRHRSDLLLDLAALLRWAPAAGSSTEWGLARKSRAPSLYQRYPWSTQPMAALMNNYVGDGNGYIGNPDLRPEVATTAALTVERWDADQERWSLKATAFVTEVQHYIDARRCDFGQCGAANTSARQAFVLLQYANQRARLSGLDLSGRATLSESEALGQVSARLGLKIQRGHNRHTGDGLYNIMPPSATLAIEQRAGGWQATLELQAVAAKTRVSQVRNEIGTAGYTLLNLRAGHDWKWLRLEFGIDNLLDRFHTPPLAGAYLGQGRSMTSAGIPWGTTVPGTGRSAQASMQLAF